MIFPHFATSARWNAANSPGVLPRMSTPMLSVAPPRVNGVTGLCESATLLSTICLTISTRPPETPRAIVDRVLRSHVYVQAGRERRRMTDEMLGVLGEHDALVTLGPCPAPRLDAERTFGFVFGCGTSRISPRRSQSPVSPALCSAPGSRAPDCPLSIQITCARTLLECSVEQAGLKLDDAQMELLHTAAPHALAMAKRLRIDLDWAAEPATTFRLDDWK